MIDAPFRTELPGVLWVTEVPTAVPDATLGLLPGLRTGDGAVESGEVVTDDPDHRPKRVVRVRPRGEFETGGPYESVISTSIPSRAAASRKVGTVR